MGKCSVCGSTSPTISESIGICKKCLIREPRDGVLELAKRVHGSARRAWGLPPEVPRTGEIRCNICINQCSIPTGDRGFCGYWLNDGGKLRPLFGFDKIFLEYYLDPLPTNCVATPVCPAATGCGYPRYAIRNGAEVGYYNLAVFLSACNLDCLFCQNYVYKQALSSKRPDFVHDFEELVKVAKNPKITCICYFGGDPTPFAPQLIKLTKIILDEARGSIKRICWETNGLVHPSLMKRMAELSLVSGGIVKIDWKCFTPQVYTVLTGVDGWKAIERIKRNIELIAKMSRQRPEVPLLVVSTLLVPGYVDVDEVRGIAKFLASIDPSIPYILLAFHPDHNLRDLPPTSVKHAEEAVKAAREEGLVNVYLENVWLLGNYY